MQHYGVPATCRADWAAVLALGAVDIHSAIGIHPWFAAEAGADDLAALSQLLAQHPQALVGEIGLDFLHETPSNKARARQISLFEQQLRLAEQHRRPVIIHNLKASAAIVGAVRTTRFSQGGIVHAFSGSLEEAQAMIRASVGEMAEYLLEGDLRRNEPLPKEDWEMCADLDTCRKCNFYELCKPELEC